MKKPVKLPEEIFPEAGGGFAEGARPKCVFCNAEWDDAMIRVFNVDARHGPDSWDFGPEDQRASIDITCSTCQRLIYRKEYRA
jgi:formate dehydrogenase maturation protein FdhE